MKTPTRTDNRGRIWWCCGTGSLVIALTSGHAQGPSYSVTGLPLQPRAINVAGQVVGSRQLFPLANPMLELHGAGGAPIATNERHAGSRDHGDPVGADQ